MFLKNRNISSKIKRSKVTDYAALTPKAPFISEETAFTSCVQNKAWYVLHVNRLLTDTSRMSMYFSYLK